MLFKMWLFESENNKPNKIGKYKIVYIDSKKFRKLSLGNEEFCNIAIHEDFPKSIKPNEIWIDNSISNEEIPSFLKGVISRLKMSKTKNDAYELSIKKEKEYRHKHQSKLIHKKLCKLEDDKGDYEVFLVNGKAVRDKYKTDFSQGGHGYVYDWIPKNEIWLEKEEYDEAPYILVHEYTEMILMRDKKINYVKAHDEASKIEMKFRKDKHSIKKLTKIPEIVMSYLKENN